MTEFTTLDQLRAACRDLPAGDAEAAAAVAERQGQLTKPPGSLGRLESLAAWLACWQRRPMPRLDRVEVLVFAGNHGVAARGVSAYPPEVTVQMVANFAAGGAAINQLAKQAGATLRVLPLELDRPTRDMVVEPAMDKDEFLTAVNVGFGAVSPTADLACLGEMGIGNTTAASAVAAGLFGGQHRWAGAGTGLDAAGIARKQAVVDAALARHGGLDPIGVAQALGRAGAGGDPRRHAGGAAARCPGGAGWLRLHRCRRAAGVHDGWGAGPRAACPRIGRGDASGAGAIAGADAAARPWAAAGRGVRAALAVPLLRAALACHAGMATFAEAAVSNRD